MMWSTTLANFKENLNKIALDVHEDDDDEDEDDNDTASAISHSRHSSSFSDRRFSYNSARSLSNSNYPVANGFDSPSSSEIDQYRAEIKRLQDSEAQIKALSVNYAALLKEREDQIAQLNEENGSLKQNLVATNAALETSRIESLKTSTSSPAVLRGSDQSPNRHHKATSKNRSSGYPSQNSVMSKQDPVSNGVAHSMQPDVSRKIESRNSNSESREKELADLLEEKNQSLAALQATHQQQIKLLEVELDKARGKLGNMEFKLQEEQKSIKYFKEEQNSLKMEKNKLLAEMNQIRDELNRKSAEIRHLQTELNESGNAEADGAVDSLKRVVSTLEKENSQLKMEKDELRVALEAASISSAQKIIENVSGASDNLSNGINENAQPSGDFPGKKEMELSLQKLEKDLKDACREKDKALHQLNRLKQHLLDKESEESEKMDEDSKIIEELRETNEYLRAQIRHLEKSLAQAITSQEEVKMTNSNELLKSKEIIDDLNRKLASVTTTIDAKNVELLNLQTALGQYYAEIEAKEHLEGDLVSARQESARLSGLLKDAHEQAEISKREKEEVSVKLSQAEKMIAEGKSRVNKLEEDNGKLRRALEQSMTRLNRMSMDSDYSVDRRIVIKLLVTYFQRNHSKEVLELMVRMLGFSEEDKQRIGVAQQGAGKGVVRGVFGLPGRLVGGILGGSSTEVPTNTASDNQSFADMWVDFLLKETEEREKREAQATSGSSGNQHGTNASENASPVLDRRSNPSLNQNQSPPSSRGSLLQAEHTEVASPITDRLNYQSPPSSRGSLFHAEQDRRSNPSLNQQYQSPTSSRGSMFQAEHSDSEFSTVPLTSSESNSRLSRLFPGSGY